jgi:5'-3' exonuclease
MGIKNLNKFLLDNCKKHSIQKKHLKIFHGKIITIDTSIYMYKYAEKGKLIESMYDMISVLLYYKIHPIFIFDGKPPKEKYDIIKKRKQDKQQAEEKYNLLKDQLDEIRQDSKDPTAITATTPSLQKPDTKEGMWEDEVRANKILSEMTKLKNQFVRIYPKDIEAVKELMIQHGVQYIDAEGEADQLCAKMVIQKNAWACMSDDTDMFVYGCTRIMRYFNLNKHTVVYYNTNSILRELNLSLQEFREIIVLSGTDYNIHQKISLYKAFKLHKEYNASGSLNIPHSYGCGRDFNQEKLSFYEWLSKKYTIDIKKLYNVYRMFDISRF